MRVGATLIPVLLLTLMCSDKIARNPSLIQEKAEQALSVWINENHDKVIDQFRAQHAQVGAVEINRRLRPCHVGRRSTSYT